MSGNINCKIVLRHTTGGKANSVQEFPLAEKSEFRLGRDPSCEIVFDSPRDDVVSRTHAIIRVTSGEKPGFAIEDLGSRNGTFHNKKKIDGVVELLPDDTVSLGLNGPSFIFDLAPRPANLVARTRVLDVTPAAATTVIAADASNPSVIGIDMRAGTRAATSAFGTQATASLPVEKETIGRNTMLHEIGKVRGEADVERRATNQKWFAALGVLALLALAGGGLLFWKQSHDDKAAQMALQHAREEASLLKQESEAQANEASASMRRQMGIGPQDIVRQYGPATALLVAQWRLFDKTTGRPVFQKVVTYEAKTYPLYVKLPDGSVVAWLTLDDENRRNRSINENVQGTAFVVSEHGYLLTSKHLAAAWRLPFSSCNCLAKEGILVEETGNKRKPLKFIVINTDEFSSLKNWVPESGGPLFPSSNIKEIGHSSIPDPRNNEKRDFFGKNEVLTVQFTGQRLDINASLVRYSNDNDVALIKIDSPQSLHKVEISEIPPASGEKTVVLGFPDIAAKIFALSPTIENGQYKTNKEMIPEPYVTEGIIALVSSQIVSRNNITMVSNDGDIMQMTINSTGAGNSGGPVFNSQGKVVGIFTYSINSGNAHGTGAVPIKYGAELFNSQ